MIVSCPACATHYHHVDEGSVITARCSQCDEAFPLEGQKRRYVVTSDPTPQTDPLLTAALDVTAPLVDRPDPSLIPQPSEVDDTATAADEGFFGDSLGDDEALFGMEDSADSADSDPAAAEEAESPRKSRPAHPVRETAAVFLLAGLGAAAGYQGSIEFGFELLNAIGVGLGVGITFGWAWIRWAERKR